MTTKKLTSLLSDKQMREWIDQSKFLRECKTKGFKFLESKGHLKGGITQSVEKAAPEHTPLEFAQRASQMVNDGMRISEATAAFGRSPGDLRYYCDKFDIQCESKFKRKEWDYPSTYKRISRYMNTVGLNIKETSIKLGCSPKLVTNILASKGRFYNIKTNKIERITKS